MSDSDWQLFSSKLRRQEIAKKTLILKQGQVEKHLSYIEKGIIRFFVPHEANELTFSFAFENSFVSAYDSFLTQLPSSYHVQALTDNVLWTLAYQDLQVIYENTDIGNKIGRLASEELFLKKSKRELSLLNDTAGKPRQFFNAFALYSGAISIAISLCIFVV